jgi:hypothetical protein
VRGIVTWAITALLVGCAAAGPWTKPGADATAIASASQECRAMAATAVAPEIGIDEDIQATRQSDWQRAPTGQIASESLREETRSRAQSIIDACMRAHGFTRSP